MTPQKNLLSKSPALLGLKKMIEYSLGKVIPKGLVSISFWRRLEMFLNFQKFSICFLGLIVYIQILIYRNFDFLDKSVTIVGILLVSTLMLFFYFLFFLFSMAVFGWGKNNTKGSCSCDPVVSTGTSSYSLCFFEKKKLQLKKNKWISCCFFNNTKCHKNVTKPQ